MVQSLFLQLGGEAWTSAQPDESTVHNLSHRKMLTTCTEYIMLLLYHRKVVRGCCQLYCSLHNVLLPLQNIRTLHKRPTTDVVHKMVSLYHRKVIS